MLASACNAALNYLSSFSENQKENPAQRWAPRAHRPCASSRLTTPAPRTSPACRAATCRREQIWGNQGQARRQSADQKEIVENEQAPLAIAMCPGSVLACGCLFGGSFFYPRPYTPGPSSPAVLKLAWLTNNARKFMLPTLPNLCSCGVRWQIVPGMLGAPEREWRRGNKRPRASHLGRGTQRRWPGRVSPWDL